MWRLICRVLGAMLVVLLSETFSYLTVSSQKATFRTRDSLENIVPNVFYQHLLSALHVFNDH